MFWKKHSEEQIKQRVFDALKQNKNYAEQTVIGVPASHLDEKIFNQDASFLKDAPYISTLIKNPNHIGCHTLGKSESFFAGTQAIELDALRICAEDILKAKPNAYDGYVASGGTEANLQAIWIYRNLFQKEFGASVDEIAILCSEDSHYSMQKAGNVLVLKNYNVPIHDEERIPSKASILETITQAKEEGKKYFIVVVNMMTTMFGSVDSIDHYLAALEEAQVEYRVHVDGAYGGFYYPFACSDSILNFDNDAVDSVTLDAHKMAQAPYGTGVFICRKGLISYANTDSASYVEGEDYTLIGSRSGANAVAIWMILAKTGPYGWEEKVFTLQNRAQWLAQNLERLGIPHFRHPHSNIVTMESSHIPGELMKEFGLVPDNHNKPKWCKIVIMDHVTKDLLSLFLEKLEQALSLQLAD
jgi:tyrosine decarboxylase/aspartate 1-decarboxylase